MMYILIHVDVVCGDKVTGVTDVSNFDIYAPDNSEPPDDLTGWDKDF